MCMYTHLYVTQCIFKSFMDWKLTLMHSIQPFQIASTIQINKTI